MCYIFLRSYRVQDRYHTGAHGLRVVLVGTKTEQNSGRRPGVHRETNGTPGAHAYSDTQYTKDTIRKRFDNF